MTVLLLIRHALTDVTGKKLSGWTPDVHLNTRGREQAEGLAERLAPLRIAALYSSPLERCRETAAPVAAQKALKIQRRKDLGEVRYGDWTNKSLRQLAKTALWQTVQNNPAAARFPNGESLLECQTRVAAEAGRLADEHPDQMVALFSHGDPIRLLLAHFAGVHADHFQRIMVSPASVSVVALGHGVPRIVRMNDTGGLDELVEHPSDKKLRG
jgi:probable phosphoglycerate mutase